MMMNYDVAMNNYFKGMINGTLRVPDYMKQVNPPSLWAYYETLPKWLRDHPIVRNVLMAFEYHKPTLGIRDKELALNYACSFIRPIDKALEDVIIEIATSNKIRLNIALGKEMVNELKFYDIDPDTLGSETEEEIPETANVDVDPSQASMEKGIDEEEEEDLIKERTAMEKFASGLDEETREREQKKIMEEEQNINVFTVEPELEKVLTDFYVKPYAGPHHVFEDPHPILPLNFYDNEDGFWDDYIQHKKNRMADNEMIINRKFMKH